MKRLKNLSSTSLLIASLELRNSVKNYLISIFDCVTRIKGMDFEELITKLKELINLSVLTLGFYEYMASSQRKK